MSYIYSTISTIWKVAAVLHLVNPSQPPQEVIAEKTPPKYTIEATVEPATETTVEPAAEVIVNPQIIKYQRKIQVLLRAIDLNNFLFTQMIDDVPIERLEFILERMTNLTNKLVKTQLEIIKLM
jgi:hypothetical protein